MTTGSFGGLGNGIFVARINNPPSYLQWCGQGRTLGLRTAKALNVAVTYLDLKILGHAGLAVHVLALFKAKAAGAQLLHEADSTSKNLTVKRFLPLCLIKVQELR